MLRRNVDFSAYRSLEVLMKCRLREKSFLEIVFEEELVEKFITKLLNVITVAVETQSRLVVVRGGVDGAVAGGAAVRGELRSWIGLTTSPRHS